MHISRSIISVVNKKVEEPPSPRLPKKAAITIEDDQLIFSKPSIYSKPFAILKKGRLCKIHKCKDDWCKISVEKYKGWVKKDVLWGLL